MQAIRRLIVVFSKEQRNIFRRCLCRPDHCWNHHAQHTDNQQERQYLLTDFHGLFLFSIFHLFLNGLLHHADQANTRIHTSSFQMPPTRQPENTHSKKRTLTGAASLKSEKSERFRFHLSCEIGTVISGNICIFSIANQAAFFNPFICFSSFCFSTCFPSGFMVYLADRQPSAICCRLFFKNNSACSLA